jgi:dihydroanticapsin dehydrogenase
LLAGRVAVVIGGAGAIGGATCAGFVAEGAEVVVADLDGCAAADVLRALEPPGRACFVATDVTSDASIVHLFSEVDRLHGRVDVLVNGAAAFVMKGADATVDDWQRSLATNVIGYALAAREAARRMRERGSGAIVNISSISAFIAQEQHLTYSAAKAAVTQMTRCLAQELAPAGIRVNAVCPGTVWTPRTAAYVHRAYGLDGREAADAHPEIGGRCLMGRTADPSEVAAAITFLASDHASFITGENLVVDGGRLVV